MTALQYVENVLKDNWSSSAGGRPHDVGQLGGRIKLVYESSDEWRRMDLANYDYITLVDGGIANISPTSFGWRNEDQSMRVDIDIRTHGWPNEDRPGRISLWGERGAGNLGTNEAPRHGGLVGEALRVMRIPRTGDQEFSLISTPEANDLSGQMGGQVWRAVVTVQLDVRSTLINTTAATGAAEGYGTSYGTSYGNE